MTPGAGSSHRTKWKAHAESETRAAAGRPVDEVAADISQALADAAGARVDHIVEIHDLEGGWAVHLAATGNHDGDGGRSEWLVLVDEHGTVVELERVGSRA